MDRERITLIKTTYILRLLWIFCNNFYQVLELNTMYEYGQEKKAKVPFVWSFRCCDCCLCWWSWYVETDMDCWIFWHLLTYKTMILVLGVGVIYCQIICCFTIYCLKMIRDMVMCVIYCPTLGLQKKLPESSLAFLVWLQLLIHFKILLLVGVS